LARHPINLPRKKRTREHVLADLGANHVEKVALGRGYAVDRVWHDYGLDLALYTSISAVTSKAASCGYR
jgi:hypothetical protein